MGHCFCTSLVICMKRRMAPGVATHSQRGIAVLCFRRALGKTKFGVPVTQSTREKVVILASTYTYPHTLLEAKRFTTPSVLSISFLLYTYTVVVGFPWPSIAGVQKHRLFSSPRLERAFHLLFLSFCKSGADPAGGDVC
jgi:hypothetical protein